jgi:hypothetical protein
MPCTHISSMEQPSSLLVSLRNIYSFTAPESPVRHGQPMPTLVEQLVTYYNGTRAHLEDVLNQLESATDGLVIVNFITREIVLLSNRNGSSVGLYWLLFRIESTEASRAKV